jgi:hypothetical protein
MKALRELANCDRPWAAERAQIALDLAAQYENDELSADEFKELLEDLVRTDKLDDEADDMEIKTLLVTGVYALSKMI